jgi:UDP-glucose 4-epimerase
MRLAITGGAGFVGSNLADAALAAGHTVAIIDNFSTGSRRFLEHLDGDGRVVVHELDVAAEGRDLADALDGMDAVFHLAANADVRYGWDNPRRDLEQNVISTHNVAEAMRAVGVRRLLFSSTGSVYGTTDIIPTPEDCPFPVQTSLYGASKAAAEGFLAAYAEAGHLDVTIFRFVSIMGARYTHGHVVDFLRKLRADPTRLEILGDGAQRKSYLAVPDCVAAMLHLLPPTEPFSVFNLGVDSYCTVVESAGWISDRLGLSPRLEFSGGDRGWIGDNPFIWLDTARIRATGWTTTLTIREAVESTVDYLVENDWILDRVEQRV